MTEAELGDVAAPLAWKLEEGATGQRLQVPLEAGKGKETDSPLEPPEATSPADTLSLAP